MSLLGPDKFQIEEHFDVDYVGSPKNSVWQQIKFSIHFIWMAIRLKPKYIIIAHVNFSGLAVLISKLIGAKSILNVYGLELWSGMSKDASFGLSKVDFIISDCHNTKEYLVQNNLRLEEDITVIWDCVDLEKFSPFKGDFSALKAKYSIDDKGRFSILTLGRIAYEAKHKGYHRLLEVFEKLDHSKFYLIIAGKGNMLKDLKEIVQSKGIESSVCFTGMIHEEDMANLYSFPTVFSLVSEVGIGMGEGIPLTPLEAMACGTPIIVGSQDGSREAIFDNKNGFVINPEDLNEHQQCFEKLINNKKLVDLKSKEAYTIAQRRFSYTRFLDEHTSFFEKIK